VDLQERHQLDLDLARERVAKVKARARPWQSIFALILAVAAAAISTQARHTADMLATGQPVNTMLSPLGRPANLALEYGLAAAFFLLAGFATIGLGNKAREVLQPSVGSDHAAVIRFAILIVGGLATIVVTLELLNIAVTQLIVGGAVTGVLVGIAAQQSLANVFAGIVLLMAKPFQVGDRVGIRAGALSGLIEGTVTEVSVTYVRLETASGPVHIPNSQVLAAAVGPAGAVPAPPGQSPPAGQGAPSGQGTPSGQGAPSGQGTPTAHGTPFRRRRTHPAGQAAVQTDPPPDPGSAPAGQAAVQTDPPPDPGSAPAGSGAPAPSSTPAELAPADKGTPSGAAAAPTAPSEPTRQDPAG
jgi:Mechanosensitive ion channel